MSDHDINVLNSVTKTLIDSCKGYADCCELADDSHSLQSEFARRLASRQALVNEFQSHVRSLGGTAEDDGSMKGAVHRGFTRFTALFKGDEQAAVSALDD